MPDNKLKQFHDSIKGNPNISGVPEDFSRFESALKNPSTSKAFFDAISKNEAIGGLPKDYNTFASSLGIVEKKNPNAPTASSGMGVSMAGKGSDRSVLGNYGISTKPKQKEATTGVPVSIASPELLKQSGFKPKEQFSNLGNLNKEVVEKVKTVTQNQQKEIQKMAGGPKGMLEAANDAIVSTLTSGTASLVSGAAGLIGGLADLVIDKTPEQSKKAPFLSPEWFKSKTPFVQQGEVADPAWWSNQGVRDKLFEWSNKLSEIAQGESEAAKTELGVVNTKDSSVDAILKGNYKDAAKSLLVEIGTVIPQLAVVYGSGGSSVALGGVSASAAGSDMTRQYGEDQDISTTDFIQGVNIGLINYISEKIFGTDIAAAKLLGQKLSGLLGTSGRALQQQIRNEGVDAVKGKLIRSFGEVLKATGKGAREEVFEENLVSAVSFLIDSVDEDKFNKEGYEQLLKDMAQNTLIAGPLGGGMSFMAAQASFKPLTKEEKTKIERYQEVIDSETASNDVKKIAQAKLDAINNGAAVKAEENYDKVMELPLEERVLVMDKMNKVKSLEAEYETLLDMDMRDDVIKTITQLDKEISLALNPKEAEVQGSARGIEPLGDIESTAKALESLPKDKDGNIEGIDLSPLDLENEGIITWNRKDSKSVAEAYHKAKADDSNPELVNAVEKLLGGTPKVGEGVVTENDKAIADALATPENTAKALESASTFQPKRIEELTAPKIGYSATLFDKDGKVVENKIEVLDIDTETNIATIVGAKGREKKVPVARIRKTIEQVSKEFHSGDIEPELLTDIVTKDISDPAINQQRRMSAKVSGVGQKNLISRTPTWIQNIYKKFISAGDRNTLRALEAKNSIMAEKQDRLAEGSKRISDSLRKDPSLRKAANTVLSQDYIDDKIDSFTNKKTDEAIAVLTGTDIEQLREAYEKPDLESSRLLLAQVNDNLKSQTTNGSKKEVDDLVYAEVTKDREKVRDLATRWVNVGRENNTASARKQARDDIENQLSQLTNGEEIIDTLKASRKETISAKRELLKTKPGRELLSTMNESRDMIDEFAKWVEGNLAALNIKDRDIGQSIINNSGLYMKKTYDYWTDKDFTLDEKLGKQAVDSIKRAMLPQRLSALASTKKFESASENKRAKMIQKLEEKAEQDASKIFTNYVADITAKKDYKPSTVKVNAAKVQSKNTWEREFINEEFGRILGKSEDAIDRLHASVMAQAQIQSAAEMGMILEQLSGGDFYNSRESAIDALLKTGMSEVEAGVYIGKNYKEVSDRFSPLNGKLIPTEMYDMVYEDLNTSHSALFNWLKAATVLWRMSKTVFNPSGHITNALGGNISIAEQGHLIDSQTVNFFMDRFRLMGGSGKISDEAKAIKSKMIDTGLWGSSVSLGEINLLLKHSNDLNSGDKNRSEKALIALKKGFNEKFGGVKRYYSATDDFSKLILFHKKKDVFAKKLYGKPYESLNSKEEAIVDANIAERVKQNMPTSSRIPKFAKAIIGSVVIGDFQGFRFGAFTSFANTLGNAVGDINKGLNDKSLSKEQKKAYLLDGAKTLSASAAIFSVDKSIGATVAGWSSIALGNMAKGLFDKEEDEDGKPIGTRFDFYQNIKNSFILPNWAKGQNMIVTSDDGKGNLQLMNLSNTFPNDEAYQLLGAQENLPLISMDGDSGISSVLKKTFSLNAVLNIFNNVVRGYDNWNRPIEDGVLTKSLYVAGEFAIPSIKHLHKEAVTYAKNQVGQEPEDYNELDTRKVEVFNYLKGMLSNSPQLIKRTFPLKMNQAIYYNLKAFYNGKETKFERLTETEKYQRIKELEPVRKAFVEMKKYNIHQKNSVPADEVFDRAFTGLRGKVSEEEQNYILTGEKPFNE